jgi:aerobic carbon-monoxide dehydrogenase large subunit
MSYAFVLRAPVAHAHIKRIDATAARRMPEVPLVATCADVRADGLDEVPCMVPSVNRDGTARHNTPRPVLALVKVRRVGQPVALVVAETFNAARDAAEAIEVEYDQLPAVTEAKDAIAAGGGPQLFDHVPGNIVFDRDNDMGDAKATEAAFAKASRVGSTQRNTLISGGPDQRNSSNT